MSRTAIIVVIFFAVAVVHGISHAERLGKYIAMAELLPHEVYQNDSGQSFGDWLATIIPYVSGGRDNVPFKKSYALVIGISDFNEHFNSLPNTYENPKKMTEFLISQKFDLVITLKNDRATKNRIETLMVDVFPALVTDEDRFLFYFSGHGVVQSSGEGFLPLTTSGNRYSKMLPMNSIRIWDGSLRKAKQALFIVDTCFSGLAGISAQTDIRNKSFDQLSGYGHHLITAATEGEQTIASDVFSGSIFTAALINAARGVADRPIRWDANGDGKKEEVKDGVVSMYELLADVRTEVALAANQVGWGAPITPQLYPLRRGTGEFFFVTEEQVEEAARIKVTVRSQGYETSTGENGSVVQRSAFETGFNYPSAADQTEPNLIIPERILSGNYEIINDRPWRRKTLVSTPNHEVFQPRAKIVDGDLFIFYLEKQNGFDPGPIFLSEYNVQTKKAKRVDQLHYGGLGYYFNTSQNLKIVGDYVYYFAGRQGDGRKYKIGSNEPATDESFFHERDDWFITATSPNGRYIAAANSNNWAQSALENATTDYLLAMGDERGEFTGISIYDKASKEVKILFKQEYTGGWSIGNIIWADDNTRIFFDNAGAVACIWEYRITERKLRKIVPEHSAWYPFFFRYRNKDYILYVDRGNLMVATE